MKQYFTFLFLKLKNKHEIVRFAFPYGKVS